MAWFDDLFGSSSPQTGDLTSANRFDPSGDDTRMQAHDEALAKLRDEDLFQQETEWRDAGYPSGGGPFIPFGGTASASPQPNMPSNSLATAMSPSTRPSDATFHPEADDFYSTPIAASGPPLSTAGGNAALSPPLKFWPVPDYGTLNPGNHATGEGIGTFGSPRDGGRKHQGIDIQAPVGTPVVAAADGRVVDVYPPPKSDFGNQVVIDHGNGLFTQSAHLNMLSVRPGDAVSAGQIIGLSGRTGKVPNGASSHVHYEVRLGSKSPVVGGGKVDDPLRYLPPPPTK